LDNIFYLFDLVFAFSFSISILTELRLFILDVSFRLRSDMTNYKEMPPIGTSFQYVIDSYFWNLPLDADVNKSTKLDPNSAYTDDRHKQTE
jgi:hypothetical protein